MQRQMVSGVNESVGVISISLCLAFAIHDTDGFSCVAPSAQSSVNALLSRSHPENNILFYRKLFHNRIYIIVSFTISQLIHFSVIVIYYC